MKTIFILVSAVAYAAFLALPVNGEITLSLSFGAGLASILSADYGRRVVSLVPTRSTARSRESLRLAA